MNYEVTALVRVRITLGEHADASLAEARGDEIIESLYDVEEVKDVEMVDWDMIEW